jgi:O-antigen/teichoic acid export membrane protein
MIRSTGLYSLAVLVQRGSSILLLPLYTRYLTRSDYGVLELLDLILTLASMLVSVQLSTALFYYYHQAASDSDRRRDVVSAFFGTVLLGVSVVVVGVAFSSSISRIVFDSTAYEGLVRIVLLGLGFNLPAEFGLAVLRLHDKANIYTLVCIGRVFASVTLNVVFLIALGLGVATMPWSGLIVSCGLAIVFTVRILAEYPPALFHLATLRKMMIYGLPLGISTAGEVILHFGDRLFLSKAVSLDDLGLYGLAYKFGMVVPFAAMPFYNYWASQMVGIIQRPQGEQVYARVATYLLLGFTLVVLLTSAFINPVLTVMVDAKFRGAAKLVPWIALAYLVRGMGAYWSNVFLLVKRPSIVAQITWIGAGGCFLAYALLIPRFGVWGAVAATHLGFALMASCALWKGQRLRPFRYEYGRWCKILFCGATAASPTLILNPSDFTVQLALGCACVCLFPCLLWITRFQTKDEVHTLAGAFRKRLCQPLAVPESDTASL